MTSQRNWAVRR